MMFLFLTTLHHRRHIEDILNCLALPKNSIIRWRYDARYIHGNQKRCCFNNKGLLAYLCVDEHGNTGILPLRYAKILNSTKYGSIIEYELRLEGYPADHSLTQIAELTPSQNRWFSEALEKRKEGTKVDSFLVGMLDKSVLQRQVDCSVNNWHRTVRAFMSTNISSLPTDFVFYIAPINNKTSSNIVNRRGWGIIDTNEKIAFQICYLVREETDRPIGKAIGEIQLEASNCNLSFSTTARVRVDCRADVKSIMLISGSGYKTHNGHISIRVKKFIYQENNRDEEVMARLDIPVQVGKWKPRIASFIASLGIAVGILGFDNIGLDYEPWYIAIILPIAYAALRQGFK